MHEFIACSVLSARTYVAVSNAFIALIDIVPCRPVVITIIRRIKSHRIESSKPLCD